MPRSPEQVPGHLSVGCFSIALAKEFYINDKLLYAELQEELRLFYQENPDRFHPFLVKEQNVLLQEGRDLKRIDSNTFALFSEILSGRLGFDRDDIPQKKYYDYVCQQIYCFFSSKSGYKEDYFTASALKEMLVATIAVQISQETGWSVSLVAAAVTLVLSATVKIGIRAWCQYYEESRPEHKE